MEVYLVTYVVYSDPIYVQTIQKSLTPAVEILTCM